MTTGGMLLKKATPQQRRQAGVADDAMALLVEHVGQYGAHGVAKRAGVKKGDILIAFDNRTDLLREADLFRHAQWERKPGERVPIAVSRAGKRLEMTLLMQK